MIEIVSPRELRDFLMSLLDAPEYAMMPNHYRLAVAEYTTVYHRACLENRQQPLLHFLHRILPVRESDGLTARQWVRLQGRFN